MEFDQVFARMRAGQKMRLPHWPTGHWLAMIEVDRLDGDRLQRKKILARFHPQEGVGSYTPSQEEMLEKSWVVFRS